MKNSFFGGLLATLALALGASSAAAQSDFTVRIPVGSVSYLGAGTTIDFGNVLVNSTASRTLVVTYTGSGKTVIGNIQVAGQPVTLANNTCTPGKALSYYQSCQFTVSLTPALAGRWDAGLSVEHSASSTPYVYYLKSFGVTGDFALQFDTSLLDFGNQPIQTTSTTRNLTIRNTGSVPVTAVSFALQDNATYFQMESGNCEVTLAPGDSCQVEARFSPRLLGTASSRLRMELEDGTLLHVATLSGAGVQGLPSFDASTLTFQGVPVGGTMTKTLKLSNVGTGAFGISGLTLSGDSQFTIKSTTCGASLEAGAACTVDITASPSSADIRTGVLTLAATGVSTSVSRVQMYSQPAAAAAALEVTPNTLDFGDVVVGQTATQQLTLRSTGNVPVVVNGYAVVGVNNVEFVPANASTCLGSLEPGMQCVLQVSAAPVAGGARSAQLTIDANTPSPAAPVNLVAKGLSGLLTAAPASLTFPATAIGNSSSLTVVLSNQGDAPLSMTAVNVGSTLGSAVTTTGCAGSSLAPGATCDLTVRFEPSAVSTLTGNLAVVNTGSSPSTPVAVAAQGIPAPTPAASLGVFSCTPTPVQTGSLATCTATLRSTGTAALSVGSLSRTGTQFGTPASTCASSLAAGASCQVSTTVSSTSAGSVSTTVSVNTSAGVQSGVATANIQAPSVALTPVPHGIVQVGSSNVRAHLLANTGAFPVTVSMPATLAATTGLVVGGTPAAGTVCSNGQSLAAGQTCVVPTTCTPVSAALLSASLAVPTSAGPANGSVTCQGEYPPATGAALSFSPNPVDVGGVALGASGSKVVTVTNNALTAVTVSGISLTGTSSAEYSLTANGCLKTLSPGASCQFTVNAAPAAAGLRQAQLNVSANTASAVPALAVRMTGLQGTLSLSPASTDFGSVQVGQSKSASFTATNTGTAALSVSSIALTGADAARFSLGANTCSSATLAVGGTCSVAVVFSPASATSVNAGLSVGSANASNATVSATLTGLGTPAPAPAGVVSLGADCATTVQYGQTANCTATVTSTGNVPLVIKGYSLKRTQGDFAATGPASTASTAAAFAALTGGAAYDGNTGQLSLPPGASAALPLTVTASLSTTASALTYTAQAGTHVNTVTFSLASGTLANAAATFKVQAPVLLVTPTPASLALVPGQVGTFSVTVQNQGVGPVKFANAATGTSAPAALAAVSGSSGWLSLGTGGSCASSTTLNPGVSCTAVVSCTPSAANASSTARLTFNTAVTVGASNALLPRTQDLSCAGVPATATVTPSYPGMTSAVATGSRSGNWLRFTNTSTAPMTVATLSDDPAFLLYTDSSNTGHCAVGKVLQAGAYCDFAQFVVKENTAAAPANVTSTKGYVNTDKGAFTFSSNYSVYAVSVTPVSAVGSSIQKGETRDVTLRLTNNTPSSLSSPVIAVGSGMTLKSNDCGTLASSASCTAVVTLAPALSLTGTSFPVSLTLSGRFETILNGVKYPATATSTAGGWTSSLNLSSPAASFTQGTHTNVLVGQSSTATSVLSNTGSGPVTVATPTVAGAAYTITGNDCPAALNAGQTCSITTRFSPTTPGPQAGTMAVNTSAGTKNASWNAVGLVTNPLSNGSVDFGTIAAGTTAVRTLTVTNGSAQPLVVSSITLPANVTRPAVLSGDCQVGNFTLAAGSTCVLRLQWAPLDAGTLAGTMVFASNYATMPSVSVSLTGVAQGGELSVVAGSTSCDRPTTLMLGSTLRCTAVLQNTGVANVVIDGSAIVPAPSNPGGVADVGFNQASLQTNNSAAGPWNVTVDGQDFTLYNRTFLKNGTAINSLDISASGGASITSTTYYRLFKYPDGTSWFEGLASGTINKWTIPPGGKITVSKSFGRYWDTFMTSSCTPGYMPNPVTFAYCFPGNYGADVYLASKGQVVKKVSFGATYTAPSMSITSTVASGTMLRTGQSAVFTATNNGIEAMTLGAISAPSYYLGWPDNKRYGTYATTTCGSTLAPGATCTVTITCGSVYPAPYNPYTAWAQINFVKKIDNAYSGSTVLDGYWLSGPASSGASEAVGGANAYYQLGCRQ